VSDTVTDLGYVYTVWMSDSSSTSIVAEDAPLVDRAMKQWAERRIDTWLALAGPAGSEFSLLASTITSTQRTTAACRRDATLRDKALEDERTENRRAAGYIEAE
jgi:hypothetical protein